MKVYVVFHNESYEYSHPFAAFSSQELAEKWIRQFGAKSFTHGIQELEVDYCPKDYKGIEENQIEYWQSGEKTNLP